jgi:hypothetical protein
MPENQETNEQVSTGLEALASPVSPAQTSGLDKPAEALPSFLVKDAAAAAAPNPGPSPEQIAEAEREAALALQREVDRAELERAEDEKNRVHARQLAEAEEAAQKAPTVEIPAAETENQKSVREFTDKLVAARSAPEVVHPPQPMAPRMAEQTMAEQAAGRKMNEHHKAQQDLRPVVAAHPSEGTSTPVFRPVSGEGLKEQRPSSLKG